MRTPRCSFLSPCLPEELLIQILNQPNYHTTLIICSSRAGFLASLLQNLQQQDSEDERQGQYHNRKHRLLTSPINQVAISRHVRTVYVPTVAHLRAYLSVFSLPSDSNSKAGPQPATARAWESGEQQYNRHQKQGGEAQRLLLFGFLDLHYDTSEWSAQGIGTSIAALVDLADHLRWAVAIVEPRRPVEKRRRHDVWGTAARLDHGEERGEEEDDDVDDFWRGGEQQEWAHEAGTMSEDENEHQDDHDGDDCSNSSKTPLESLLEQTIPILSGGAAARRKLLDAYDDSGWSGRTVQVGAVMGRWFRFREWDPSGGGRLDF